MALPDASQVQRMEAHVGNSWRGLENTPRFEVPREHIAKIMRRLSGFAHDPDAERRSKLGLGILWLHCDDGSKVEVRLYHSYGICICIYCIGDRRFKCYSSGSDRDVDDAIRAAYAASGNVAWRLQSWERWPE
jgi:hypothetical protein